MTKRIALVLKGYPRLSETFIAQEIFGLEQRGFDILIVSLRKPTDGAVHPVHEAIRAPVLYLPEYLKDDAARVRAGRAASREMAGFSAAQALYDKDRARDNSASRHRRWGQAAVLAAELPSDVSMIYVHYLHTPASVARYAARIRGLPYAFSAHAKDIYTTPQWELAEKIADAEWGATCTRYNHEVLSNLADRPGKVDLVYHGLDLAPFVPPRERADGGPVRIVSVCRAVEKKGLDDLLRALARLPGDVDYRFEHIGGGPLVARLEALAERLGIADRVAFRGPMARAKVIEAYARADIFALASRVAKNGDRDGLPNVIMEAMAMGLPVVSTDVSAVPEVVAPDTGLLVRPRDPRAFAEALAVLARDGGMRRRLGTNGLVRVKAQFSPEPGLDHLARRLAMGAMSAAA